MKNYFGIKLSSFCIMLLLSFFANDIVAQSCNLLTATSTTLESRCAATGSIQVAATGGSGNYIYRVFGPVNTNYSTNNNITGLSSGNYVVVIKDNITNCVFQSDSVNVAGTYKDPGFLMNKTDVSCINGNNGTISLSSQEFGLGPFNYTIVSPSASQVGVSNTAGVFIGLISGDYLGYSCKCKPKIKNPKMSHF